MPARRARFYVVQVALGRERTMAEYLTSMFAGAVTEPVYQPRYATEARSDGRWVPVERNLLRGYLVAVSNDPDALEAAAHSTVEFCRVLSTDAGPCPLSPEEAALFGGLGEPGRRVVPMSRGYRMPDGGFVVTEGPLASREPLIERVDRHRSTAVLAVDVGGDVVRARCGLALLPAPEGAELRALERLASRRADGARSRRCAA